jgi:helicase SWR1
VHIYRLVSERTVEENILKKALQKRQLEQLTLQEGEFSPAALAAMATASVDVRELLGEGYRERETCCVLFLTVVWF